MFSAYICEIPVGSVSRMPEVSPKLSSSINMSDFLSLYLDDLAESSKLK